MNQPIPQPHDFPPHALGTIQRLIATYGRNGATRLYRVPLGAAVANNAQSAGIPVRFRKDGVVLALYGSTLGATAAEAAGLEVRIQMSGVEDLFTDGDSSAFASYRALFGDAQNWFPVNRPVSQGQDWVTTFNNVTNASITPSLYFALLEAQ